MAVETGTATSYTDLLAKLKTFLTGLASNPWVALKDADGELILQGEGLAGLDEIFVGIKTYYDAPGDYYNWRLQGYTGYSAGLTFDTQPGAITTEVSQNYCPRLCLWNSSIPYWFIANGRRFIVIAKVSTVYQVLYMGFIRAYATPGQYPYPLAIGGSSNAQSGNRWSIQNAVNVGACPMPVGNYAGTATLRLRDQSGAWQGIRNNTGVLYTWPYAGSGLSAAHANPETIREGIDGTYPLLPVILHSSSPTQIYGELEGIFHVSGFNNAAENLVVDSGSDEHLVVQDVYRTGINNYFAVLLE